MIFPRGSGFVHAHNCSIVAQVLLFFANTAIRCQPGLGWSQGNPPRPALVQKPQRMLSFRRNELYPRGDRGNRDKNGREAPRGSAEGLYTSPTKHPARSAKGKRAHLGPLGSTERAEYPYLSFKNVPSLVFGWQSCYDAGLQMKANRVRRAEQYLAEVAHKRVSCPPPGLLPLAQGAETRWRSLVVRRKYGSPRHLIILNQLRPFRSRGLHEVMLRIVSGESAES